MASVREIARKAGVSIATVSRVLNEHPGVGDQARQKVLEVATKSGYVRRVGKRAVAEGIALAYAGPTSVESPFDHGLLQGIGWAVDRTSGVERFGHDLLLISLPHSLRPGESPTQLFLRKGIKGAVLRSTEEGRGLCEQVAAEGFPAVVVGERFNDSSPVSFIDATSRQSSFEAVQYLIQLGHRRIAMIANAHDDTDHIDRIAGWREAHAEVGMSVDESLLIRIWASLDGGLQAGRRLTSMPANQRPTAAYVADPMASLGVLRAVQESGLVVPRDFSIVGFDDGQLRRHSFPMLSAVCQNSVNLGVRAVKMLRELIARQSSPEDNAPIPNLPPLRVTLPTTFEVGGTTGPVPEPPTV